MIKTLPLKGLKSYFALQAYAKIMLGLKMLPAYGKYHYTEFFEMVEAMPARDQEAIIREAVLLVDLEDFEIEALSRFCVDSNGVPYSKENLKNLDPNEIFEILITVCLEVAKIKPRLTTDEEKKN